MIVVHVQTIILILNLLECHDCCTDFYVAINNVNAICP